MLSALYLPCIILLHLQKHVVCVSVQRALCQCDHGVKAGSGGHDGLLCSLAYCQCNHGVEVGSGGHNGLLCSLAY